MLSSRRKCLLACIAFVLVIAACGTTHEQARVHVETKSTMSTTSSTTTTTPIDWAAVVRLDEAVRWQRLARHAFEIAETERRSALRERAAGSHARVSPSPVSAPPGPCGGAYPPCYVAQRESGNTYDAYNPDGCGGHACYGRWQFSGAWAGKLGLPNDLSTATPAQQDEAARILWNNGAGCSNWAAC